MSTKSGKDRAPRQTGVNRRNLLLGSSSLMAASTLIGTARAQQTPEQPSGQAQRPAGQRPPNILMIMGDDIGWFNPSIYHRGMMGYRTPNIDRIAQGRRAVHRLVRPAELHRRPRGIHHRPVADPHRADQGRPARAPTSACRPRTRASPSS